MAVPEQIPVVNYVADGVVKKFDVPFEYDQQSDLHLYVDGDEPTIDKYFFADNSFNFYIAPTNGQGVKIKRITPKERDTDYDLHTNTVRPKAVNSDFDRIWLVIQEVFSDIGGLSQAVQDEIIARIHGDDDLLNQLTAEISARMLGDEAVTEELKNYVNQVVGAIINDPIFDGIDADKVNDASGETQQQVNYNGGSKWHPRVGGYPLNARVVLDNGDIVKSTIDGNTNDPNVDMTGWENLSKITFSLTDSGGEGGGANDTAALLNAVSKHDEVILNTDVSIIKQAIIDKKVNLHGSTTLKQDVPNQHTLVIGTAAQDAANEKINGFKIGGVTFGEMPKASADDFGALFLAATKNAISYFNHYYRTENGIIPSVGNFGWSKPDYGSTDTLILGDVFEETKRFIAQNIQGRNTKIIGITAHNNGDNTLVPSGEVNNGGANGGVRLSGISRGNIISASNIRDKWSAIDIQLGSRYNTLSGLYLENSYASSINISAANYAIDGKQNMQGLTIVNAGDAGAMLRYIGHSRLNALIDTTGLTTGSAGYGVDGFSMVANDEHYIIEFSSGSGLVPTVGTVITQGTVTGVLVRVVAESLATVAVGTTMPAKGTILVKTVTGGFFKSGALTGVTATATRAYAAEGRNRIDVSTSNTKSTGARIATNGNLIDLISTDSKANDLDLTGKYNIVRVVVGDNPNSSYSIVNGSHNIVLITDNEKVTTKTCLLISGSNNIVIGATSARVSISGSNNYCDLVCSRADITGNDNDIGGQIAVISDTGTGNKFNRTKKGQSSGVVSITTNANGEAIVPHGLANTAKSFVCNVVGSSELLHVTVSNVANSTANSLVKVWLAAGTPAISKTLTISYIATM